MALRTAIRVVGFLALTATVARAEMPSGAYTISVEGDSGLVLPSDDLVECSEGICIDASMETSTTGAISGAGVMNGESEGVAIDLSVVIGGQVSGSTAKPKVTMSVQVDGTAEYGGMEFLVRGSGRAKCGLDRLDPSQLQCKGPLKLCVYDGSKKLGCDSGPFFDTLIPLERVPFEIALDLATSEKNAITGTGEVSIDAMPALAYTAKGKYKPKSDTSSVKLAGVDRLAKTKIAVSKTVLAEGGASGGVLTFKIAGQKGKLTLPAP